MRRLCKYCGAEYDGDPGGSCCPDCAARQRETTLRPRTCRACGATFCGGPRAWYCPTCRAERKAEATRRYRQAGPARPLGSEDLCEICGQPYTVMSARQRYCTGCAEDAIRAVDRQQSLAWNREHTTPDQRRRTRQNATATIRCVICGRGFVPRTVAKTCSPECSMELKRQNMARFEQENREARNAYRAKRRREQREKD